MAFKSLEDVYANQCAGKPVVPLQRHVLNELYNVTLKNNNKVEVNQQISPEMFDQMKRQVKRSTAHNGMVIDNKPVSVDDILDRVLRVSGWSKGQSPAEYRQSFLDPVTRIFDSVDINEKAFIPWYYSMNVKSSPFTTWIFSEDGRNAKDLKEFISTEFTNLFVNTDDALSVFTQLYNLKASIGDVAVGRGEIAMTLVSEAKKGLTGDLEANGKQIELKGIGAKVGGDGFALKQSATIINKILPQDLSLTQLQINDAKIKINTILTTAQSKIDQELSKQDAIIKSLSTQQQRELSKHDYKKLLAAQQKSKALIYSHSIFEQALEDLRKIDDIPKILSFIQSLSTITDQNGKKIMLVSDINEMHKIVASAKKTSDRGEHTFSSAADVLFSSIEKILEYKSTTSRYSGYDTLIEGIAALRSYSGTNVASLKDGLKTIVTIDTAPSFMLPENNRRLVAAIHVACYLEAEKFDYMLFMNGYSKQAISYSAPKDAKIETLIVTLYNFFLAKPQFTFGTLSDKTGRSKSVPVTYGPTPRKEVVEVEE